MEGVCHAVLLINRGTMCYIYCDTLMMLIGHDTIV